MLYVCNTLLRLQPTIMILQKVSYVNLKTLRFLYQLMLSLSIVHYFYLFENEDKSHEEFFTYEGTNFQEHECFRTANTSEFPFHYMLPQHLTRRSNLNKIWLEEAQIKKEKRKIAEILVIRIAVITHRM